MTIFLAGIIQGSKIQAVINEQDWRTEIRAILERRLPQAEIYCHYSAHPNSITYELPEIKETFEEGVRRCVDADLTICYLPSASMGTAIEMFEAYRAGKCVITITPMAANWVVRLYSHVILPDTDSLDEFLAAGRLEECLEKDNA